MNAALVSITRPGLFVHCFSSCPWPSLMASTGQILLQSPQFTQLTSAGRVSAKQTFRQESQSLHAEVLKYLINENLLKISSKPPVGHI